MNPLKRLAGQTAIYGASSIIGRFLNYLLVPLYTNIFNPSEYGTVTELYTYAGFLLVLLTYGMETAFFRFFNSQKNNKKVFSTALFSVGVTTIVFCIISLLLLDKISAGLNYSGHPEYIVWFILIMTFDVITALPFAKLRAENKAVSFATVRLINIAINIGLNLFFLVVCRHYFNSGVENFFSQLYNPDLGVGYIFISNLVASFVTFVILIPSLFEIRKGFDFSLWRSMFSYAFPLLVVGIAGIIIEMLDRALLKYLLPYDLETNLAQLGIYGAVYKLGMIMYLFIQAFRYAAEPFFFSEYTKNNDRKIFADVLKYFVVFAGFIFLAVLLYLDIVKFYIGKDFHEGIFIVPVLLFTYILFGIHINLSIWFKLTDQTKIGAFIAITGAVVTIILNFLWIPVYGYAGSAWATFFSYFIMVLITYFMGRKYFPVPYNIKFILGFLLLILVLYYLSQLFSDIAGYKYVINTALLLVYIFAAYQLTFRKIIGEWLLSRKE